MNSKIASLYMKIEITLPRKSLLGGTLIATSKNFPLLNNIAKILATHLRSKIPVVSFPQPHVLMPVPSTAALLLLHEDVDLKVAIHDCEIRILMSSIFGQGAIDIHEPGAMLSVIDVIVLTNWD